MLDKSEGLSLGLNGIKERIAMCNGTLAIESAPGNGSILRIRIPLESIQNAHSNSDCR
jgi:signal transduction histidine kinase